MISLKFLVQRETAEAHEFSIKYEKIFLISPQERFFRHEPDRDISQTKNKEKHGSCFTIVYRQRDASLDLMNSLDADGRRGMEAI